MLSQYIRQPQYIFILRQLSALISAGDSYTQARDKLEDSIENKDKKYLAQIDKLMALDHTETTSNDHLSKIIKAIKSESGDISTFLCSFHKMISNNPINQKTFWTGIITMLGYGVFLLLFATMCLAIFALFVFPQLQLAFPENSEMLPKFSIFIFSNHNIIIAVMLSLSLLLLALMVYIFFFIRQNMIAMKPLSGFVIKLLMRNLAKQYNQYIFCSYTDLIYKSKVDINKSMQIANDTIYGSTKQNKSTFDKNIQLSCKLNTLEQEISYLKEQQLSEVIDRLVKFADHFSMVSKPILYIALSALIIAMYLPIFALGSVGTY